MFFAQGAVPATVGIIKGRVHVGLTREQLELLASSREPCVKTSRRDLPYVLSKVGSLELPSLKTTTFNNATQHLEAERWHHCVGYHARCCQGWHTNFCHW